MQRRGNICAGWQVFVLGGIGAGFVGAQISATKTVHDFEVIESKYSLIVELCSNNNGPVSYNDYVVRCRNGTEFNLYGVRE